MLNFINEQTVKVGPLPWAESLDSASDDVQGSDALIFEAFLLGLALSRPERGVEHIFEYSFDQIHHAMGGSALPYEASVLLESQLPEVGWWRRWDSCYRLRLAVVRAFVRAELEPSTFLRLSSDQRLMSELFEVVEAEPQARSYLGQLRTVVRSEHNKSNSSISDA